MLRTARRAREGKSTEDGYTNAVPTRKSRENHEKKRLKIDAHALLEGTEGREFAQGRLGWTTRVPRSAQERPESAQERPKSIQERPKSGQEWPRAAQSGPRASKSGPGLGKSGPWVANSSQKCAALGRV